LEEKIGVITFHKTSFLSSNPDLQILMLSIYLNIFTWM